MVPGAISFLTWRSFTVPTSCGRILAWSFTLSHGTVLGAGAGGVGFLNRGPGQTPLDLAN